MQTLFQHTRLLLHLFTIGTPPPLETLVEVHLPQSNNTSLIITVFKFSSTKVDKSTRYCHLKYSNFKVLRPLGIDNTVIVDVFLLNPMTQAQIDLQKQAQIDLQKQLEQATPADLTTRPLLNDSPVLYIETSEQTPPTFFDQL